MNSLAYVCVIKLVCIYVYSDRVEIVTSHIFLQRQVFPNLCMLTQECKNLKVRINAASALRAPSTREQYGDHFIVVWRGIMASMENAANVDDFSEYRHKDNLIEQVSYFVWPNAAENRNCSRKGFIPQIIIKNL